MKKPKSKLAPLGHRPARTSLPEPEAAAAFAAPIAANAAPKSKRMTEAEYTSRMKYTIIGSPAKRRRA